MLTENERQEIRKRLRREPSFTEEMLFDVMWSEHVSYKSSKRWFKYFHKESPRLFLGIGEGAGLLDVGDDYLVGLALESHNHPSSVDPFNGAATGVGGIIRDIISQGCHPIALLDSIRFGEITNNRSRFLFEQVVQGIASYGNSVGIPNLGGEVEFHESYQENCLVNVGCVGIVKKDQVIRSIAKQVGDVFVLFGGSTGRDGIHGVTFASEELSSDSTEDRGSVQIGDPLVEKSLIDVITELREENLINGLQDLGGGGLTCAASEMCARGGVGTVIHVEKIPLREKDMKPWEIMISESQERMLAVVSKENIERVREIITRHDLNVSVIGEILEEPRFMVKDHDEIVADIPVKALVDDVPEPERDVQVLKERINAPLDLPDTNLRGTLLKVLAHPNLSAKDWVYEQYDKTVQANTITEPGLGAGVIQLENGKVLVVTTDSLPLQVKAHPYHGAILTASKALRRIVSTGATPLALLDNLNFGNPERLDSYTEFVEAIKGIGEFTKTFEIPVVGGNVSLYNEAEIKKKRLKINPTPVIMLAGLLDSHDNLLKNEAQQEGNILLVLGEFKGNLSASYAEYILTGETGESYLESNLDEEYKSMKAVLKLHEQELLEGSSSIDKGGLWLALIKYTRFTPYSFSLSIGPSPVSLGTFLLSEEPARYLVEVKSKHYEIVTGILKDLQVRFKRIGKITKGTSIRINDIEFEKQELLNTYTNTLMKYMEE